MNLTLKSRRTVRHPLAAFTLIELLVVIGIIALLASLIVGTAAIANSKMRQSAVQAEMAQLINAIDTYKKDKGFYPPDSTLTALTSFTYQNTLFYELTGASTIGNPPTGFSSKISGETGTTLANSANLPTAFGVGGILNSSADASAPAKNYFPGLKANQHAVVSTNGATFSVLGIAVPGTVQLVPAAGYAGSTMNPWHYNVSSPTNNTTSYDLWMDVFWGGHTNRVCNWSRDPIVLN